MDKVRIDKWLWAARFFKTRALAKTAIDNGKVLMGGQSPQKTKPSRMLERGLTLKIRQGFDDRVIIVQDLSDKRQNASAAQSLYRETEESIEARQKLAAERRAANSSTPRTIRPNKKQRRQIHRFLRND